MKQKITLVLLIASLLFSNRIIGQKETNHFSVGFGIEAGLPTGSAGGLYGGEIGGTIRFSYHAGPGFITLTSGILRYYSKKAENQVTYSGHQIPIRAGYKYIIRHHYFVMGEVGNSTFHSFKNDKGNYTNKETTTSSLIGAISMGVQFNAFEIGLRYGFNFQNKLKVKI